jgi:hypothetical protein
MYLLNGAQIMPFDSKNIKDWHLVYEDGAYALFKSYI